MKLFPVNAFSSKIPMGMTLVGALGLSGVGMAASVISRTEAAQLLRSLPIPNSDGQTETIWGGCRLTFLKYDSANPDQVLVEVNAPKPGFFETILPTSANYPIYKDEVSNGYRLSYHVPDHRFRDRAHVGQWFVWDIVYSLSWQGGTLSLSQSGTETHYPDRTVRKVDSTVACHE